MIDSKTLAAPVPPQAARASVQASAAHRSLPGEWLAWALLLIGLALVPLLMGDSDYRMAQFAKYLALAVLALGIDLVWGYTGMLTLGQGLYFGFGAYALAYCVEMQQVAAV